MIGELRTLLARSAYQIPVATEGVNVFFSTSLEHFYDNVYDVILKEGDVCIVLYRDNNLLYVLTAAGAGFTEVLDTGTIYGEYGKFYTHQWRHCESLNEERSCDRS